MFSIEDGILLVQNDIDRETTQTIPVSVEVKDMIGNVFIKIVPILY